MVAYTGTKANYIKGGFIKDMKTGLTCPLKWVGHWSCDILKGCAIPFKSVPRMELKVDRVYQIVFNHVSKKYNHEVSGYFKLYGVDFIDDHSSCTKKKNSKRTTDPNNYKHHKFLKFILVNPLEACELIHEEPS